MTSSNFLSIYIIDFNFVVYRIIFKSYGRVEKTVGLKFELVSACNHEESFGHR